MKKKSSEDKLRQMYDDRIAVMQTMLDGLHDALQKEINANAALVAENGQLARELNNMMGRTA